MVAKGESGRGPVLEDEFLRLRPLTISDVKTWHEGEDEQIRKWFQFPRPSSPQDVTQAIQRWSRSWSEGGPVRNFGIWVREGDILVGGVEIRVRDEGVAYLSFQIFAGHRRRGHASAAVRMAVDYAHSVLGLERLVIITDTKNTPSRGVAEAAGFRLDGPADPAEHIEIGEMLRYVNP